MSTVTSAYSVASPKRVAYYPVWSSTASDTQVSYPEPTQNVPWSMITHINLAFAGINRSGQCAWVLSDGQTADTTSQNNAQALINYRNANAPNVKVLVSVGGATMSDGFSDAAQDSTHRSAFVTSCINLMNAIGADGLDWDWEYPGQWDYTPQTSNFPGGTGDCPSYRTDCSRTTDVSNYTAMLNAFRANSGMNGKLMTAAVRPNRSGDSNNVPYQYGSFFGTSPRNFDFVNLMTYDDFGTWATSVNFCAPYDWATSSLGYWSSQVGSTYNDSLILGVPFYGPAWQNISSNPPDSTGVNSGNLTGTQIASSFSGEGNVSFGKAKATFVQGHSSNCTVKTPTSNYTGYPTNVDMRYVYCSGTLSSVNVEGHTESLTNTWISYEDSFVIQNKANYVTANNYGGMMWWSQGEDSSTNELVTTIYNAIQTSGTPEGPFGGTAAGIPGTITAANYDVGTGYVGTCSSAPSSAAYCDTTAGNAGGHYRTDDVDIELSSDTGGGYDVGYIAAGEFLKYTVNVSPANYNVALRVASATSGQTMHVEFDGTNMTGSIAVPNTGGLQTYQTVNVSNVNLSSLTSGNHIMKVVFDTGSIAITTIQFTTAPGSVWSSQDVAAVGTTGSWSQSGSTYTVNGSGTDVWGTGDQFRYVYQLLTGDSTIVARVTGVTKDAGPNALNGWAKAGVMMRDGFGGGATDAFMLVSPTASNSYRWQVRSASGGQTTSTAAPSACGNGVAPVWLKIVRSGSTLTGYCSPDGNTWTQAGSTTISMSSTIELGLAVTSHDNTVGQLATGTFDNVSVTSQACVPTTCAAQGDNCGNISNGCGGTLSCGSCTAPQYCGGGGTANVCSNDTIAPSVPTGLSQTASTSTSITIGWTASTDNVGVTGYNVYRGGTKIGTSTTTSYTDSTTTAATSYSYTVSAYDAAGNTSAQSSALSSCAPTTCAALSYTCGSAGNGCGGTLSCGSCTSSQVCTSNVCVADTTAPSTPAGLAKTGATGSTISLSWTASTDSDSSISGYNVYRNGTKVGTATSTSYTDTGLAASTSYSYTISAYDPAGNTSAQSSSLSASTTAGSCSISVTTNTYDTTYDGNITYKNTGTGAETNPVVKFTIPSGATLDTTGCAWANQTAPGCTAVSCSQSGTTVTYSFTGSLAASSSIALYYSTQNASEAAASGITVTATACP